jgi:hypothetical protein
MNLPEKIGLIVLAAGAALLIVVGRFSGDGMMSGAGFVPKWLGRFVMGGRGHRQSD